MRLIVHGKTDKGLVRKENEDAFCIEKDLGLLAIADGMGGHAYRLQDGDIIQVAGIKMNFNLKE